MQTRHPSLYGPRPKRGLVPGALFEESEAGLTLRARPLVPAAGLAFRESARGGAVIQLGAEPTEDEWFVVDETTGGIRLNPGLISA